MSDDRLDLAAFVFAETLVWYDQPLLFTVAQPDGRVLLANLVDESGRVQTFLYTPISDERLAGLKAGSVFLRDVWVRPEGIVWKVVFDYTDGEPVVDVAVVDLPIDEQWLPKTDVALPVADTKGSVRG